MSMPPAQPGEYPPPTHPVPVQPTGSPVTPPRPKSFWKTTKGQLTIIGIILAGVAAWIGIILLGNTTSRQAADPVDVRTSCELDGRVVTTSYTVHNRDDHVHRVTLRFEYRDGGGARVATDAARLGSVAAGDTVRGEESTYLGASVESVRCKVVDIDVD